MGEPVPPRHYFSPTTPKSSFTLPYPLPPPHRPPGRTAHSHLPPSPPPPPADPPGRPTISGYSPGEALREGETLILTCRASGGKPPPWLVWRRGGRVLDDTSATEDGGGVVNALEVEVSAAEDGAVFECEVNSDLLEEELRTNVTLTVHCTFPMTCRRLRAWRWHSKLIYIAFSAL